MKLFKSKKAIIAICSVILSVALIFTLSSLANAENVKTEEYTNPDLGFERIFGEAPTTAGKIWTSDGYLDQSNGTYNLNTNSYCAWWEQDACDFAYKQLDFAYGSDGLLVCETVLTSWNAATNYNAGAGLMIRTGLEPGAPNLFFHMRPGHMMVIERAESNGVTSIVKSITGAPNYPISMKIELKNNKATVYIKQNGQADYGKFCVAPFIAKSTMYAGLCAYTVNQDEMATASFSGFHAYVEVPEGTERQEGDESQTSSGGSSSEESIKLPPDPEASPNVLMRETFTSGKLVHDEPSYPNAVNWEYSAKYPPVIVTTDDLQNRYLYNWMDNPAYFYAGDQHWSDYTTEMDLTFTSDYSEEGINQFYVFTRHTDVSEFGCHDYAVCFTQTKGVRYLSLGRRNSTKYDTSPTILSATDKLHDDDVFQIEYEWMPASGEKTVHLKIENFDNRMVVWMDGVEVLRYTDDTNAYNGTGSIGFLMKEVAIKIDNIVVTEEVDLLGGEWDNLIGGNFDQPVLDIAKDYASKKYEGFTSYSFSPSSKK